MRWCVHITKYVDIGNSNNISILMHVKIEILHEFLHVCAYVWVYVMYACGTYKRKIAS